MWVLVVVANYRFSTREKIVMYRNAKRYDTICAKSCREADQKSFLVLFLEKEHPSFSN
jgi:hypothetical protein